MSTKDMRVAGRFKNSIIENDRRKPVGDRVPFGAPFLLPGVGVGIGRVGPGRAGGRRTGYSVGNVNLTRARPPA